MVVGFTTVYAISTYNQKRCEFESRLAITLCDKALSLSVTYGSSVAPVTSINKTDRHDITEILLKVALNTIKQTMFCEFISIC